MTIGLLGVGLLGSAIADRLQAAGYRWIGYDPKRPELAGSPEQVLQNSEIIILSLPDSSYTARLLPALDTAPMIIDATTGDPAEMAGFGEILQGRYMDATIGGSSAQVRAGSALLMAGASEENFQRHEQLLKNICPKLFYCGPPGSGARMKLVFNLVLGLNRAALAEGLAFAEACGIGPATALEILQSGPAASAIMERKGPKMVSREYTPEARLAQHHKDVRLILAEAERHGLKLPLEAAHKTVLELAEAKGHAESDNSALIEAYR